MWCSHKWRVGGGVFLKKKEEKKIKEKITKRKRDKKKKTKIVTKNRIGIPFFWGGGGLFFEGF